MQVIALLEAYAKRSPQAALLLRALPVLLGTLRRAVAAGAPEQALAERLRGLITNRLCKCVQLHCYAGLCFVAASQIWWHLQGLECE